MPPIPSVYVTRFFQLITARRFAEAERVLLRLRQKISRTEWNTGYFQALRGMLLAQKSNDDRYAFLSNLNWKDQDELKDYRREFLRSSKNKLHADYDRGYFAAWAGYMRVLSKLESTTDKPKTKRPKKKEAKAQAVVKKRTPKTGAKTPQGTTKVVEKKKEPKKIESGRTEEAAKKIQAETEKRKEIEEAEKTERTEPRQSNLFDFSK
ncbi:MAG: hypothetical protein PVF15_02415 [Candidatus Bathyarchaeota archaeon]|jgi:hypothetical protein